MRKVLRRRVLPFVRRRWSFVVVRSSSSYNVNVSGKIKNDDEAKKRQKNRIGGKVILVATAGFEIYCPWRRLKYEQCEFFRNLTVLDTKFLQRAAPFLETEIANSPLNFT